MCACQLPASCARAPSRTVLRVARTIRAPARAASGRISRRAVGSTTPVSTTNARLRSASVARRRSIVSRSRSGSMPDNGSSTLVRSCAVARSIKVHAVNGSVSGAQSSRCAKPQPHGKLYALTPNETCSFGTRSIMGLLLRNRLADVIIRIPVLARLRARCTKPMTSGTTVGSGISSARQVCDRWTVERQGSGSVSSAHATACGLLCGSPLARVCRARHIVSTTYALWLLGRSQSGSSGWSAQSAQSRSRARTAARSSSGEMGAMRVFGSGPRSVTPCSRTVQRSRTQL
jgi:hypothetical protein